MSKRKVGEVLWLALQCAKTDRIGLIDAYSGDTSETAVRQAKSDVKAFEQLQVRLFGTTRSQLDAMMDAMTPKSIFAILHDELDD